MRSTVTRVLELTAWLTVAAAATGCSDDPDSFQPTRASDAAVASDASRPDAGGFDAAVGSLTDGGIDAGLDASLHEAADAAASDASDGDAAR